MADDTLSTIDLLNFNNSVLQRNPYGIASQSIGAWQPQMQTWSGAEQGVGSFAKSFLQGLLGNYAQQDAANQMASVVGTLPQLASNPMGAVAPEGVDQSAYNLLKGSAMLKKQMREENIKSALGVTDDPGIQELISKVLVKRKADEAKGTIQGTLEGYGLGKGDNTTGAPGAELLPNSPQFLNKKRVQDEEDAARNELLTGSKYPAVQKFNMTTTALSQLKDIKDLNTASSDIPFATLFIGGLDGSVVKEGEYARVAGANPLLAKFQNQIEGALNGTSTLGVDIKRQMYGELVKTQKGLHAAALLEAMPRVSTAKSRGADPINVLPFPVDMKFDEGPGAPQVTIPGLNRGVPADTARRIIADAKAKFGNTPEAKKEVERQLMMLGAPNVGGIPAG
jgi:hypothetical protein